MNSTPTASKLFGDQEQPTLLPEQARKAYWAEGDVAQRLGVSVQLLRKQRSQGTGIRYHRFGKAIRYRISDVIEYEERCAERFIGQQKSNPSQA